MSRTFKVGILPFKQYDNVAIPGSTFLRAVGIIANSENYTIWKHAVKYDGLIFQKNYWTEMMNLFEGPKILDLCDADWFKSSNDFFDFCNKADAITCSSNTLTEFVKKLLPSKLIYHVPDRLDFNHFPKVKQTHMTVAQTVVWFGYIHNAYATLTSMFPIIRRFDLHLKIISDKPYEHTDDLIGISYTYIKYNQANVYEEIIQSDIVLNPKSIKVPFKYKSNNKTIIGWKLGLPVAEHPDDLIRFIDPYERTKELNGKAKLIETEYDIKKSVLDYNSIFSQLL